MKTTIAAIPVKIVYTPSEPFTGIISRFITGMLLEGEGMVIADFFRQDMLDIQQMTLTLGGIYLTPGDQIKHGNWNQDPNNPPPLKTTSFALDPDDW